MKTVVSLADAERIRHVAGRIARDRRDGADLVGDLIGQCERCDGGRRQRESEAGGQHGRRCQQVGEPTMAAGGNTTSISQKGVLEPSETT